MVIDRVRLTKRIIPEVLPRLHPRLLLPPSPQSTYAVFFVYPGTGQFIIVYIAVVGFMYTAEHATQKLQEQCLAAILRQNIARFGNLGAREIFTNITANMDLVLLGISEKVTLCASIRLKGGITRLFRCQEGTIFGHLVAVV
jgi:hypothetical protein